MNQLQERLLATFEVVQKVCRDNGLRYFASGGTAIGALREGGFLSWDDDIDIEMPFPDYVRFIQICRTDLPRGYAVTDYVDSEMPLSPVAVVHDEATMCTFLHGHPDSYRGVGVDICPLIGLPGDEQSSLAFMDRLHRVGTRMLLGGIYDFRHAPDTTRQLAQEFRELRERHPFDESDFVMYAIPHSIPGRRPFPRSVFDHAEEQRFEHLSVPVAQGIDEQLDRMGYGDWRVPPPPQERVGHAGWFVDLERPYREYRREAEDDFLLPALRDSYAQVGHLDRSLAEMNGTISHLSEEAGGGRVEVARLNGELVARDVEIIRLNEAYRLVSENAEAAEAAAARLTNLHAEASRSIVERDVEIIRLNEAYEELTARLLESESQLAEARLRLTSIRSLLVLIGSAVRRRLSRSAS